ncbi:ABC transporter permease [Thermococcus aggregans]|uniref:ABC transporter permease n=1 Tax=Thermococcus aggregans TaxID=110163 RepID=A0A9E7SQK4_THEAG|nr:ABC transporter permease [Thermococcus aggregans]USS41620.1 ABC transporter permease [Thermococcus aggregans]
MNVKAVNVAVKDFEVNVRTRKFQIMVALFVVLSLGMIYSSKKLGVSADLYKTPFQMFFLSGFSNAFNYSISLMGVLLGATAISGEKERGTLKVMVSKPVYRDQILLGKLLGGVLTLGLSLVLFYVITVAFALVLGVPITKKDLSMFLVTFPFSLLYGVGFLSLGLLMSTFIGKSKNATVMAVFVFIFFSFLLSAIAGVVAFAIVGLPPIPNLPENAANLTEEQLEEIIIKDPAYQQWLSEIVATTEKILYFSPNYHYGEIIRILFGGKPQINEVVSSLAYESNVVEERSIAESLGMVWENVLILVILAIFPFSVSYTKFARMEIR